MSLLKTQDARAEKLRRNPQGIERVATGIADKLTGDKYDFDKKGPSKKPTIKSSYDPVDSKLSDISKSIMEKGMDFATREKLRNKSDAGDKGSAGSSGSNTDTKIPTNTTTDTKIPGDTPSTPSIGDTPSKPLKKPKPISVNSSYDPISNKDILSISEKILKKNFNLDELNRYEKEKGEDTKTGKPVVKGGTAKDDEAFKSVAKKYAGQRMGANEKKKKRGEKKEEGGRILRMQNKKKEEKKKGEEFAARAKKKGFKSAQDYANVVARYGSEKDMEKGKGLGS